MFIVFDLDGTLANTDHRAHFVDRTKGKPDWRTYPPVQVRISAIMSVANTSPSTSCMAWFG